MSIIKTNLFLDMKKEQSQDCCNLLQIKNNVVYVFSYEVLLYMMFRFSDKLIFQGVANAFLSEPKKYLKLTLAELHSNFPIVNFEQIPRFFVEKKRNRKETLIRMKEYALEQGWNPLAPDNYIAVFTNDYLLAAIGYIAGFLTLVVDSEEYISKHSLRQYVRYVVDLEFMPYF